MSKLVLSDLDFNNVSKISNLPNASSSQEPVTLAQLNATIEGLKEKDTVQCAASSNINVASPGATIDGISLSSGDRVLLRGQGGGLENGIWIWNGAAVAMTRALDMNASSEFYNAIVPVAQGSDAGVTFRCTTLNPTIGSTNVVFVTFGTVAPAASESTAGIAEIATQAETNTGTDDARFVTPLKLANYSGLLKKYSATFGDGAATQYDITHSLNTADVLVRVYVVSSGAEVFCDQKAQSVNVVRLNFNSAPALNSLRCVVVA